MCVTKNLLTTKVDNQPPGAPPEMPLLPWQSTSLLAMGTKPCRGGAEHLQNILLPLWVTLLLRQLRVQPSPQRAGRTSEGCVGVPLV